MFGQPKQFFALTELPTDVLYIDGEIDEIRLGVRNLAIIGAILALDMALPSSSVRAASSQEEMFTRWKRRRQASRDPYDSLSTSRRGPDLPVANHVPLRSGNRPC